MLQQTETDQRREWFREHWAHGVPFNQHCGIEVRGGTPKPSSFSCPMRICSARTQASSTAGWSRRWSILLSPGR
jgi:hypothetical protein